MPDATSEIILGIDPGSRKTGYGVIAVQQGRSKFLDCGTLNVMDDDFAQRIYKIFQGISTLVARYQPTAVAIEEVFLKDNVKVALTLGQARGAAIAAVMAENDKMTLHSYSARQIKSAIVGYGAASKDQIKHMVCLLLKLEQSLQSDAADALAVALCHGHTQKGLRYLTGASRISRRRIK